ncbi:MAG: hypothetical protein IKF66_01140 [Methanobrevibacter sp.]|nr:hypothetical protein [Methanobrevibacter sp.]
MGLTEEYFWESEPKKIIALIDQKNKIEKIKNKNLAIYIASFIMGKDPDEMEKKERGLIPGIDIPVDEGLVNRLM